MQNIISKKTTQYIIKQRWFSFLDNVSQVSDKTGKILFLFTGKWNRHIFRDASGNEIFIIKPRGFLKLLGGDKGCSEIYSHNELCAIIENTTRGFFSLRDFVITLSAEKEEMMVRWQSEGFFKDKYILSRRHEDVAMLLPIRSFWRRKYLINIKEDQDNALILAMMVIVAVSIEDSGW